MFKTALINFIITVFVLKHNIFCCKQTFWVELQKDDLCHIQTLTNSEFLHQRLKNLDVISTIFIRIQIFTEFMKIFGGFILVLFGKEL